MVKTEGSRVCVRSPLQPLVLAPGACVPCRRFGSGPGRRTRRGEAGTGRSMSAGASVEGAPGAAAAVEEVDGGRMPNAGKDTPGGPGASSRASSSDGEDGEDSSSEAEVEVTRVRGTRAVIEAKPWSDGRVGSAVREARSAASDQGPPCPPAARVPAPADRTRRRRRGSRGCPRRRSSSRPRLEASIGRRRKSGATSSPRRPSSCGASARGAPARRRQRRRGGARRPSRRSGAARRRAGTTISS